MRTLAIIPARIGSERVPRKNLEKVGGLSLVRRAIAQARQAALDVVVVTDSRDISGTVTDECRVLMEPSHLAAADVPMVRVVRWAIESQIELPDRIVLLQPTSPLRIADDIKGCLDLQRRTSCDCVVSVVAKPDHTYQRNGAVYVSSVALVRMGELIGGWTQFYVMPPERSVDIDTLADLEEARRIAGG